VRAHIYKRVSALKRKILNSYFAKDRILKNVIINNYLEYSILYSLFLYGVAKMRQRGAKMRPPPPD
jgi:hypothetical protein